jgi:hypothetical protein
MTSFRFTRDDLQHLEALGLATGEVRRQLELFKHPPDFAALLRPCTAGDGIGVIPEEDHPELLDRYDAARREGRALAFVPASGAASRMFRDLLRFREDGGEVSRVRVEQQARAGDPVAREVLAFTDGLMRFPFYPLLMQVLARRGHDSDALAARGRYREILDGLLDEDGLGYADLPKALVAFHRQGDEVRTALEEHLVESTTSVQDGNGCCRIHLTVSPRHREVFLRILAGTVPRLERTLGVQFRVELSEQRRSTDTLAVDLDNGPMRDEAGRLLFRPGGHGTLIENLNDLDGDLVFVRNVDNVVPATHSEAGIRCRKLLAGLLLRIQERLVSYLSRLAAGPLAPGERQEALALAGELGALPSAESLATLTADRQDALLREALDRPLRVCGMVPHEGEPGGGPFWVGGPDGAETLQIVEGAQVDPESAGQQAIFGASTHFNPVDLVCGLRDWRGRPFDLHHFVDPDAVFISRKTWRGRPIKALEWPGLWNGAMARWLTVFIEIPPSTFQPVKTVNDLLRPAHQP